MKQYKYTGAIDIEMQGIGVVKPNQIVEAKEIDHPLFKVVDAKEAKEIKK